MYEEKAHGPNLWAPNEAENVSEEAEQAIEASISLERDIEDQLVHQLDALEEGLTFVGRQVKCDVGRVDIVSRGADGSTVVVELKVGEAKDSAIGQIARYMGWHQQHQGAGTVRGILVASDFPEGVPLTKALPRASISCSTARVCPSSGQVSGRPWARLLWPTWKWQGEKRTFWPHEKGPPESGGGRIGRRISGCLAPT